MLALIGEENEDQTVTFPDSEVRRMYQHIALLEARSERLTEALEQIRTWSQAYPRDIFAPPTEEQLRDAHASLAMLGMSLDKFSAHAMRHVAEGVGKIADAALST